MKFPASLLAIAVAASTVFAQTGTTPKTPPTKAPAAKGPKKKNDSQPGYKKDDLRGFQLYFSDEVLAQDKKSVYERSPLEALELELITVEKVIPADKVKQLKGVPIWVEWNETVDLGGVNGRAGRAVAVFYGGHQSNLLSEGSPYKNNSITILSLKKLTEEHQPKTDSGRCVTLHELAHAFQFLYLGDTKNALVKPVYQQAMERKLFDPSAYAATNDREYFAELTCAYLDQLHYTPKSRAELKTHDPKGYDLMEKSWGKIADKKDVAAAKEGKLPTPDANGKFSLDLKVENLRFEEPIVGPLPVAGDLKGRPVLTWFWSSQNPASLAALAKVNSLTNEYRDFGLFAVAVHTKGADASAVRALVKDRELAMPVVAEFTFGRADEFRLPHVLIYDHTGKCVFRGDNFEAEPYLRMVMGKAIFAKTGKDQFAKGAKPVVDLLEKGAAPLAVFAKLAAALDGASGENADDLKLILKVMTEGGTAAVDRAKESMKDEPVEAFLALERLSVAYKGTPVAKSSNDLLTKLRATPKVGAELRARPSLDAIKKLDAQLYGREGSFNPKSRDFQQENADLLKKLADATTKIRKQFPGVRATDEAAKIADRWSASAK